jgi:transcriptional regulator with XRE-family HTH domain
VDGTAAGHEPTGVSTVRDRSVTALGRAVRAARAEAGLTQSGLAVRAGVRRELVGLLERGEANPSFTTVARLAAALDLPLSELAARAELGG